MNNLQIILKHLSISPRLSCLVSLLSSSSLLWILSVYLKDVSIIDSFWSLGFLFSGFIYKNINNNNSIYQIDNINGNPPINIQNNKKSLLLSKLKQWISNRSNRNLLFVFLWGIRLSSYLTWRNYKQPEDYRYKAIRKSFGKTFMFSSLFSIFWFQAILCWIISQPLFYSIRSKYPNKMTNSDIIGSILWIIGFLFESIADYQLARFKSNPLNKGKLLDSGLWKYSRHPNYFGNSCMFWGFFLNALSVKNGWKSIYSPILITYLLMKVSGVALLEKSLSKRKQGFNYYKQTTSAFIPWFSS